MDKGAPPSRAMVAKLLKLNGLQGKFGEILNKFPATMAIPHLISRDKDVHELVAKHLDKEKVASVFHAIWAKHMTASEVLDYIAFLKTPAGQKVTEKEDTIRIEMAEAVIKIATEIALEVIKECHPEDDLEKPPEKPSEEMP